jgi:hypothetical protein
MAPSEPANEDAVPKGKKASNAQAAPAESEGKA